MLQSCGELEPKSCTISTATEILKLYSLGLFVVVVSIEGLSSFTLWDGHVKQLQWSIMLL